MKRKANNKKNNFLILKSFDSKKVFIAVGLIVWGTWFSVFVFFPLAYTFVGSFHDWNPNLGIWDFVGFKNFILVFGDKLVLRSFVNTFYFTTGVTIGRILIALLLAVAITSLPRFKNFFRTMYFVPVVCSLFAVSIVWKWMYNPNSGIINVILNFFRLPSLRWLHDPKLSLLSIMLMTIWKDLGYAVVLFLAGLTGIPRIYIEAAEIDGASKIKTFFYITLPLLRHTIVFVVIISLIGYLQTFVQMFVMRLTATGGCSDETITVAYKLYQAAFQKFQYGYASAISVLLFIITIALSLIQLRLLRVNWRY